MTPPSGVRIQAIPAGVSPPRGSFETTESPIYEKGERQSRKRWIIGGIVTGAVILVAAITLIVLLLTKQQGPTYVQQVNRYIQPVVFDNQKLAASVASLTPGSSTDPVKVLITTTQTQTQAVQQEVGSLSPSSTDETLATQVNGALSAESQWLQTASTVIATPTSPLASQLSGLGLDAQSKIEALGPRITGASHPVFPSSSQIVTYVSAVNAAAQTIASNTQFNNQASALLNQSSSTFQQVNTFFGQLQTAANGGSVDLTVPQAEQQINSIISNRQSLAAAAQALNAPTPQAQSVAALLVTAFNDSLKDDNDLATCLNQVNNGSEAFIFQSCLASTGADSNTATNDKQAFLNAYNQLRASVGQPPVNNQF